VRLKSTAIIFLIIIYGVEFILHVFFIRLADLHPTLALNETLILTGVGMRISQGVSQKKKFCPLNVNWESFFDRSKSLCRNK
jgi:hypothetical protein